MKYMIYTDGAAITQSNVCGCSFLILTNTHYIDSGYSGYTGSNNPTHAETIAVGLAAGHLIKNIRPTKEDEIEIYSDCTSTINFYKKFGFNSTNTYYNKNEKIQLAVRLVRELTANTNVVFHKIKGHKSKLNPNSCCDWLAKFAAKRVM